MMAVGDALRARPQSLRARLPNPRRLGAWALVAVLGVATAASAGVATGGVLGATASPFVGVSGGRLILEGQPWAFTGYDSYRLTSVAVGAKFNCGGLYSTTWLNQALDEMASSSGTAVVRTWFFQSYSVANYLQFDTVLAAAAQRHIKVIPVLVNQWNDCEPWSGAGRPYKPLAWYQAGYKTAGDGYPTSFRDYAVRMAARYANNTTIAFWQLVNEAEAMQSAAGPCDEGAAATAIRRFADDVAGAMKVSDPNHLISLGTIGTGQCGSSGTDYSYIHGGAIDLCEYHDYVAGPISGDQWNGIRPDINACHAMGKPIFAGEVGIDASVGPDWSTPGVVTADSLLRRAGFFQQKMGAQFSLGISGFLDWDKTLGPSGGYEIGAGDPTEGVMAVREAGIAPGLGGLPVSQAPRAAGGAPRTAHPGPAPTHAASATAPASAAVATAVPATAAPAGGSTANRPAIAPTGSQPVTTAPLPQRASSSFPTLPTAVQGLILAAVLLVLWSAASVLTGGTVITSGLRRLALSLFGIPNRPADT